MTSNQIARADLAENKRHNAETESINEQLKEESKRHNKASERAEYLKRMNESIDTLNRTWGTSMDAAIRQQNTAIEAKRARDEAEYKRKMSDISTKQQVEQERYNKTQNELTLRNIQHLEYQDQLQALRDEWQRNVDTNTATYRNADVTIRSAQNSINAYLAEIERANVNVQAYRAQIDALVSTTQAALNEAKTDEARANIVQSYIKGATAIVDSIGGSITSLLRLGL